MRCVQCARCGVVMTMGRDEMVHWAVVAGRAPGRPGLWDPYPPFPMLWTCPSCAQAVGAVLDGDGEARAEPGRAAAVSGSAAAGKG
jgi:hypothetical protein